MFADGKNRAERWNTGMWLGCWLLLLLLHRVGGARVAWKTDFLLRSSQMDEQPAEWSMQVDFSLLSAMVVGQSRNLSAAAAEMLVVAPELEFDLPQFGQVNCSMQSSRLFAPGLQLAFPEVVVRSGTCNNGRVKVFINLHIGVSTSLSATFANTSSHSQSLFLDYAHAQGEYIAYLKRTKQGENVTRGCQYDDNDLYASQKSKQTATLPTSAPSTRLYSSVTLRLAIATNREYSEFAGDTPALVLNSVAAIVSRVNGIYMRELGVYFQLVDNTHQLFCTLGRSTNCAMLPNDEGEKIIDNAYPFFQSRGVDDSSYDVGHVLTTGSGGVASLAVMCTLFKAQGTTGMRTPVGDAFSVDYVAHELGHQLNGMHTFQDCGNGGANVSPITAVEPGSGSTIMAYAGLCKTTNLQPHSDPYFHSVNIQMMQQFIQKQLAGDATCGLDRTPYVKQVKVVLPGKKTATECQIPVGNAFVLSAAASLIGPEQQRAFYQWDDINTASSTTLSSSAIFRSWKPRTVGQRFLPNLYYLTFGLQARSPYNTYERLPGKPQTLQFRFSARTRFDTNANDAWEQESDFGDFAFKDFAVVVSSTIPQLKFTQDTRQRLLRAIKAGSRFLFKWTKKRGGGTAQVEILMAVNLMQQVPLERFDYEVNVHDLDWVVLGLVPNTGKATLAIPILGSGGSISVSFMIRTPLAEAYCAALDFVGGGLLLAPLHVPTARPTLPTKSPSPKPTPKVLITTLAPTLNIAKQVFSTQVPVVQTLENACVVPSLQCNYQATGLACAGVKNVVRYEFTAPSTGTYLFSTVNPKTTCGDTVLYLLEEDACSDDLQVGNPRSQLQAAMFLGQTATLFVGGFGDHCGIKSTVSLSCTYVSSHYSTTSPTSFPTLAPTMGNPSLVLPTAIDVHPHSQTLSTCVVPSKWCNYDAYGSVCKSATHVAGYMYTAPVAGNYRFSANLISTACGNVTLYAVEFDVCGMGTAVLPLSLNQPVVVFVGSVNDQCAYGTVVTLSVSLVSPKLTPVPTKAKIK
ncbi:hypothetical protein BASA81_000687 [Batrachochytrium salamandrivorans]|nr:hypothetical protein BASA81_000687 [Batrachochytrium salamandrivorans]